MKNKFKRWSKLPSNAWKKAPSEFLPGLILPSPVSYASTEELIEITKTGWAKKGGFLFQPCQRRREILLLDAIQEEIEIGRKEPEPFLHHSHYKAAGKENWDKALTRSADD